MQCCCFLDSLTLPVYSLEDPNPIPLDSELQIPCVCGATMKRQVHSIDPIWTGPDRDILPPRLNASRLIEKQADKLLLDESDGTIEYIPAVKPDGELLTPTSPMTTYRDMFRAPPGPVASPLASPPLAETQSARTDSL